MKYLTLGLLVSLFLLFYSLFIGLPGKKSIQNWWGKTGVRLAGSLLFYIAGVKLFYSPLAGIFMAIMGWNAPAIYGHFKETKFRLHLKGLTNDFLSAASSMFGSNASNPKVIATCSERLQEPFASDFQEILGRHNFESVPIPEGVIELGEKYRLSELKAAGYIIKHSSNYGGSKAASEGLFNLQKALSNLAKRQAERVKEIHDSLTTVRIILYIIFAGLVLNAVIPAWRAVNQENPLAISVGIGLTVWYYLLLRKISRSDDLENL